VFIRKEVKVSKELIIFLKGNLVFARATVAAARAIILGTVTFAILFQTI
jgi:hypothetical protein